MFAFYRNLCFVFLDKVLKTVGTKLAVYLSCKYKKKDRKE